MAPTLMTVVYPVTPEPFNEEYYLSSHIPSVAKIWGPLGLKSWHVAKLDPSSGFVFQTVLIWESLEKLQGALGSEAGKVILTDGPNYTTGKPTTYIGGIVESGGN